MAPPKKITLEIEKYIRKNSSLSGATLRGMIKDVYGTEVTTRSVESYLTKARSEVAEENSAKIEAVRSKILDDADKWANKYLQYMDEEAESLKKLIKEADESDDPIKLETVKDRLAASAALHKMLSTIIDFVKPPENPAPKTINVNLSHLSESELEDYGRLAAKLAGIQEGKGEEKSA